MTDQLPEWRLPITTTLVVSTAIATRDFQDVHHDRDLAQSYGSQDIFLNILTTTGLVQRYVADSLGHGVDLAGIALRLGAPAYPGDELVFTGTRDGDTVTVLGAVSLWRPRDGHGDAPMTLSGRAAIVGIGATEFSKESGRSELQLSVEATQAALADCGLTPADVDGLTTFTMDSSSEIALARELGCGDLRFFSRINFGGGGACATVQQAAMAVATGVADVVVCYRGFNERSGVRFGQASVAANAQVNTNGLDNAWTYPHGLTTPAATVAMQARRYMHEYGATSEDFGRVAVADRRHAATNPNAFFFGLPITLEDHQASRMIADPLHLLDCCQESDGAVALVVVSAERARDLPVAAGVRRGGGTGKRGRPVRDDLLLPRRHRRPRDGRGRPRAVAPVRPRPRRHADGGPLRPLHAVRADAAGGARVLRPRRGS